MSLHQASGLSARGQARSLGKPKIGHETRCARVLGIVSGKGGVGKSTLAVNLATAAAASGARTLLVDGDLGLANADLLMGLVPECDLADWIEGRVDLDRVICRGPAGVQVMIAGKGPEVTGRIRQAAQGEDAKGLEQIFARQDLTILDLGAGIGEDVIELARACDPVWLVVTPEPTSLADAYVTAKTLWERAPTLRLELIVNRASDRKSGDSTYQALRRLIQRFLSRPIALRGVLPEDEAMIRSVARQRPLIHEAPNSVVARRLRLLAESLLEESRRTSPALPSSADSDNTLAG